MVHTVKYSIVERKVTLGPIETGTRSNILIVAGIEDHQFR